MKKRFLISKRRRLTLFLASFLLVFASIGVVGKQSIENINSVNAAGGHDISVDVGGGCGTVRGGGTDIPDGDYYSIWALPCDGWELNYWSNSNGGTHNGQTGTFQAYADLTWYAYFTSSGGGGGEAPIRYAIGVSVGSGCGTVRGGGDFTYGESYTIYAEPCSGYRFLYWYNSNGGTESSSHATYQAYADLDWAAYFTEDSGGGGGGDEPPVTTNYTISVSSANATMGSASGGGTFAAGSTQTISATPKSGYHFVRWDDGDTSNPRTITVNGDASYVAIFEADDTPGGGDEPPVTTYYTITVSSSNANMGSASGGGTFAAGSTHTISAEPNSGYHFLRWNDGNTSNPRTITVNGDASYVATFAIDDNPMIYYRVIVQSADENMGTVRGGGSFEEGELVTIKASPKEGYKFVKWTNNKNSQTETSSEYSFYVFRSITYTAHFEAIDTPGGDEPGGGDEPTPTTYLVTAVVAENEEDMGTVSGGGSVVAGGSTTITATPKEGYEFLGWTNNLDEGFVSTEAELEVSPESDVTYTAHFKLADDEEPGEDGGDGKDEEKDDTPVVPDTAGGKTPNTGMFLEDSEGNIAIANLALPTGIIFIALSSYLIYRSKKQVRFGKK